MDLKQQQALMDAANKYVNDGTKHLAEALGRQPTEQELIVFSSSVASMLASWVYSQIYQSGGPEPADAWMQQIFAQIGMGVKGRGVPVTLQISLHSMPDAGAEQNPGGIAQEKAPIVICKCILDDKGNCHACSEQMTENLSSLIHHMSKIEEFQKVDRCKPCVTKVFDAAFAQTIRNEFKKLKPETRDMVTAMAVQMASANGLTSIPEIEKALSEAQG